MSGAVECCKVIFSLGLHGLSCKRSQGRLPRQAGANDLIHRALRSAGIPSTLEPQGCSLENGKRPDGLTLVPWKKGKPLLWDFTCRDTFAPSYLHLTSNRVGAAAEIGEQNKHRHYDFLNNRFIFIPLALETNGVWGKEGAQLVREIGNRISEVTGENRSTKFLFERLSITLQRGNVTAILGTLPPGKELMEIFYLKAPQLEFPNKREPLFGFIRLLDICRMPFCLIVWKLIKFRRALLRVKQVKLNAYRKSIGLPPKYGCCYTLFLCVFGVLRTIFLRVFCACFFIKVKDGRTTWEVLWADGTLPNSIVKSLLGLLVGLTFTHLIAVFMIFQLNFDPVTTTYGAMILGIILTFGLAFSETSRCLLFLTVPQFFTKKGRAAILAYCLILALSGPGKNTTKNMEILTESLLCSQQMAQNATQGLIDLVKDPYSALGGAMKAMVDAVKDAAANIMGGLRLVINLIVSVVNAIKVVINWLKEIMSFCNTRVGSPSEKCRVAFDEAIVDCKDRLGVFAWMCSVVDLAKNLCHIAKWGEGVLCWLPGLIKENVLDPIKNGLKDIGTGLKTFFDVRIRFDYQLEGSFTSSKSFREVVRGMKKEILDEIHWLLDYLDYVNLLASLFMGLAVYKALIYRHRFLNIDRHDNFYITKGIVKLDLRMRRIGRPQIFPLKYRESFSYVQTFSLVLVESEQKALKIQLVFVGIATLKILIYVFIDYVFYLFLVLVQKYGAFHVDTRKLLGHGVTVSGQGFMAAMYRAILEALSPIGSLLPVFDTSPCLPDPSQPNYYRYAMIFFLVTLCFFACVTEPYGMRLRHVICGIYHPERLLPRDRWLYTDILSSRDNFISYARNELKAMMSKGKSTYRIGLAERLSHTSPCIRKILSLLRMRRKKCFLCGLPGDLDDTENFVHCPNCDSVYCSSCYEEVGGRCVACMSPIEFGDISDESGSHSSDDEEEIRKQVAIILKRRKEGVPNSSRRQRERASSPSSPSTSSSEGRKLLNNADSDSDSDEESLQIKAEENMSKEISDKETNLKIKNSLEESFRESESESDADASSISSEESSPRDSSGTEGGVSTKDDSEVLQDTSEKTLRESESDSDEEELSSILKFSSSSSSLGDEQGSTKSISEELQDPPQESSSQDAQSPTSLLSPGSSDDMDSEVSGSNTFMRESDSYEPSQHLLHDMSHASGTQDETSSYHSLEDFSTETTSESETTTGSETETVGEEIEIVSRRSLSSSQRSTETESLHLNTDEESSQSSDETIVDFDENSKYLPVQVSQGTSAQKNGESSSVRSKRIGKVTKEESLHRRSTQESTSSSASEYSGDRDDAFGPTRVLLHRPQVSLTHGVPRHTSIRMKKISPNLAERVALLDSFYSKMPFPPTANIYN